MTIKANIQTQIRGDIMDMFDKVQQIPYLMQLTCRSIIILSANWKSLERALKDCNIFKEKYLNPLSPKCFLFYLYLVICKDT